MSGTIRSVCMCRIDCLVVRSIGWCCNQPVCNFCVMLSCIYDNFAQGETMKTFALFVHWMNYVDEMRDEVGCAVNFDQWVQLRVVK